MSAVLTVRDLHAGYGRGNDVVHGVDVTVGQGEIVVALGANGAGKTTTLRAISGMIRHRGEIELHGRRLTGRPDQRARAGLAHVPQGRGTLSFLTVEENLRAAMVGVPRSKRKSAVDHWLDVFPRLRQRLHQNAGNLSGGEQQMLALARALICEPDVVLLDEPSLGLAPLLVKEVFEQLRRINAEFGTAFLVVEQNAAVSLSVADHGFILDGGRVVRAGAADFLVDDDELRRAYLGI